MTEPTIICPNCKTEIRLTESLAAPLIAATRREYEQRLSEKDAAMTKRETALHEREEALLKAKESVDSEVASRLKQERAKIEKEEAAKARQVLGADLDIKSKEIAQLQVVLKQREDRLQEAQREQANLLRKQRELDEAKRELELTVEKRVQAELSVTRDKARKEVEDELKLKVAEKEQTIDSMQKTIEELRRKAEQGSQQLQGEVQELELESLLATRFPTDTIAPVPKGEHGGDVVQRVIGPLGQTCGVILWESKRTRNWSNGWLAKLRDDQREAKADLAIIVSRALPKEVETFDYVEGVWVAHPRVAIPVALSLRQSLMEIAAARQAADGQQTKMDLVYKYLTGPHFRQRVQAIVEAFSSMQDDLAREKKLITKQWAKRDQEIGRAIEATAGMYGDLQGIAGKTLQEIEGLSLPALTDGREE